MFSYGREESATCGGLTKASDDRSARHLEGGRDRKLELGDGAVVSGGDEDVLDGHRGSQTGSTFAVARQEVEFLLFGEARGTYALSLRA